VKKSRVEVLAQPPAPGAPCGDCGGVVGIPVAFYRRRVSSAISLAVLEARVIGGDALAVSKRPMKVRRTEFTSSRIPIWP
jgi:hypothetical protein